MIYNSTAEQTDNPVGWTSVKFANVNNTLGRFTLRIDNATRNRKMAEFII